MAKNGKNLIEIVFIVETGGFLQIVGNNQQIMGKIIFSRKIEGNGGNLRKMSKID